MQTDGINEMIIYYDTFTYKHLGNYTSPWGQVSWSLRATEQATLGSKFGSWFRKIQRSLVFSRNESAARENYRVVTRSGGQSY